MIVLFLFMRKHKLNIPRTLDVVAPSLALGQAFGRLGCFLKGCCYGGVCKSAVLPSVRFPRTLDAQGSIDGSPPFIAHLEHEWVLASDQFSLPVHPTQIYSALYALAIFFVLFTFFKYRKRDGEGALLFGILYSIMRFLIEFVRSDNPKMFGGLTVSQNISVLILVPCLAAFVIGRYRLAQERREKKKRRRKRRRHKDQTPAEGAC